MVIACITLIHFVLKCDPLLLEQLWQRMSGSARDVQPGYSPKRYLSHLSHTTFDQDSWKKLVETGSLKSFGTTDDSFLPSFLPNEYDYDLNHRPPPYKTMSLPPVSPSNSMVGSFTFYKHALSTGAASMVSLPSINSDTADDQLSARTVGSFVESLAERLAEVMYRLTLNLLYFLYEDEPWTVIGEKFDFDLSCRLNQRQGLRRIMKL